MTHHTRAYSESEYPHQRITGAIVVAATAVHRALGFGFLEIVYKRAVAVELRRMGFVVDLERRYDIIYHGENIGIFKADLVVEDSVILEVKTGLVADPVAPAQTLNYLSASRLVVGLVAHFGPQVNIKRLIRRPEDPSGGMLSTL